MSTSMTEMIFVKKSRDLNQKYFLISDYIVYKNIKNDNFQRGVLSIQYVTDFSSYSLCQKQT